MYKDLKRKRTAIIFCSLNLFSVSDVLVAVVVVVYLSSLKSIRVSRFFYLSIHMLTIISLWYV